MRLGSHPLSTLERVKAAWLGEWGLANEMPKREVEIAALPRKVWRGMPVFRIRCEGPYGRGPHDLWVPEAVLWALIDIRRVRCPFHR